MDFIALIPYALIGIVAGVTSGLFGIGGGMIIVPFSLLLGISSHHAVAISVVQMIFSSIFGSYLNYKKRNLNLKDGLFVGFGGLLGASFSGIIVNFFSDITLTAIFLGVGVIFFIKYFFRSKKSVAVAKSRTEAQKRVILVGTGALVGVFAISLGIGGGVQLAAILGFALGYDSKQVARISLFYILFASVAGSLSFAREGVLNESVVTMGVAVGVGSLLGVFIGTKMMEKIKLNSHKTAMLCVYAFSILTTAFTLLRKMGILAI
ncbi:sulfite exporter TauE/SafE family protein [Helicobacter sp. 23-1045]